MIVVDNLLRNFLGIFLFLTTSLLALPGGEKTSDLFHKDLDHVQEEQGHRITEGGEDEKHSDLCERSAAFPLASEEKTSEALGNKVHSMDNPPSFYSASTAAADADYVPEPIPQKATALPKKPTEEFQGVAIKASIVPKVLPSEAASRNKGVWRDLMMEPIHEAALKPIHEAQEELTATQTKINQEISARLQSLTDPVLKEKVNQFLQAPDIQEREASSFERMRGELNKGILDPTVIHQLHEDLQEKQRSFFELVRNIPDKSLRNLLHEHMSTYSKAVIMSEALEWVKNYINAARVTIDKNILTAEEAAAAKAPAEVDKKFIREVLHLDSSQKILEKNKKIFEEISTMVSELYAQHQEYLQEARHDPLRQPAFLSHAATTTQELIERGVKRSHTIATVKGRMKSARIFFMKDREEQTSIRSTFLRLRGEEFAVNGNHEEANKFKNAAKQAKQAAEYFGKASEETRSPEERNAWIKAAQFQLQAAEKVKASLNNNDIIEILVSFGESAKQAKQAAEYFGKASEETRSPEERNAWMKVGQFKLQVAEVNFSRSRDCHLVLEYAIEKAKKAAELFEEASKPKEKRLQRLLTTEEIIDLGNVTLDLADKIAQREISAYNDAQQEAYINERFHCDPATTRRVLKEPAERSQWSDQTAPEETRSPEEERPRAEADVVATADPKEAYQAHKQQRLRSEQSKFLEYYNKFFPPQRKGGL